MSWINYRQKATKKSALKWWLLSVVLMVVFGIGFWLIVRSYPLIVKKSSTQKNETTKRKIINQSIAGRYLFNGTVVWARGIEQYSKNKDNSYNYNYPFSQLDTFNRKAYDAWITDFECPITNNVVPYETQVNKLVFNCRPEFLPQAAKYFNIFDLANNHTDNQNGQVGLTETRKHLDETPGMQYFGSFDPSISNDVCEVIGLPVRIIKSDNTETKATLPVAFCGWHYFYRTPKEGEIDVMKAYAKVMPVFAFAEMGIEYQPSADKIQQDIAHKIIEAGPEFLVANNPHWVQNTEVYKSKLIVYSTGNFIFDQLDTETQRSASLDVKVSVSYDDNIANWLELGQKCLAFHDNCLKTAQDKGLIKPVLKLQYGIVAGQGGYKKITHRADSSTQKAVELRTNWTDTCNKLGYNVCQ